MLEVFEQYKYAEIKKILSIFYGSACINSIQKPSLPWTFKHVKADWFQSKIFTNIIRSWNSSSLLYKHSWQKLWAAPWEMKVLETRKGERMFRILLKRKHFKIFLKPDLRCLFEKFSLKFEVVWDEVHRFSLSLFFLKALNCLRFWN